MIEKKLRQFGLLVGGIFLVIGISPVLLGGGSPRWAALLLAVLLIIPAILRPLILAPVYTAWMKIGHVLGWINTRILMGILYYTVITPTGIFLRLVRRDPLGLRWDPKAESYFNKKEPRPAVHMLRQF